MIFAAELSWPSIQALAQQRAVALLPVGSTEAHGPHLPLSVDVIIAHEVCRRVAERLTVPVVVFPAVTYSLTDFAAPFAGTVSIGAQTAHDFMVSVLNGIVASGFETIAVINHHLEPAHFRLVREAAKIAQAATRAHLVVPDHRRAPTGPQLGDEFMHGGSHAGQYETSLMLAVAPQLVNESVRCHLPPLDVDLSAAIKNGASNFIECGGPEAYFGTPATATPDEGHRLFEILADAAASSIRGVLK